MCLHFRDYRALRQAGHADEDLRSALQRHGMSDISLEFLGDWFLEGSAAAAAQADEVMAFAAARAFGARSLNVGSDFQGRGIPRHVMKSRFQALCERAAKQALTIALEIVPWSDVRDVETALNVIEGCDNAGLVIDSWHVFRGHVPLSDVRAIPASRIVSIQINDAAAVSEGSLQEDTLRRLPCGEGSFDLAAFLDALDAAGASVAPSVEIISPIQAALPLGEAVQRSYAGARRLLDEHLRKATAR
jgi:sugar phosphate isomerase/epimerase